MTSSNNDKANKDTPKGRDWRFWLAILIIIVVFGYLYNIYRLIKSTESREKSTIAYSISGAVDRALLMKTNDFHNTKTYIRRELDEMLSNSSPVLLNPDLKKLRTGNCKISDSGDLYAIFSDGSTSPAEYQNCYISGHKREYKGIDYVYDKFISYIPIINWIVAIYLNVDVYDSVICIPNYLINNSYKKEIFYDALENPCKYLVNSDLYREDSEREKSNHFGSFDINAWNVLGCGQDNLKTFEIKLIIESSPGNSKESTDIIIHTTNKGGK